MEKMICPICGQKLQQVTGTRKWVCLSEEHDYVTTEGEKRWYRELAEDDTLWNVSVLENAPSVIAYEYASLREMLYRGEVTGLSLKLKDVFEACLKFCVLAELSLAFGEEQIDGHYGRLLAELTNRLPSLGTWQMVGRELVSLYPKRANGLPAILRSLVKLYETEKIVHWRNKYVGHGAFTPVEAKEYQEEAIRKIRALATHFQQEEKEYKALSLELRTDVDTLVLSGSGLARNLPYTGQALFLLQSEKEVRLVPLLQNINHGIYFFDAYLEKYQVGSYLNYVEGGDKLNIPNKELEEMCRQLRRIGAIEFTGASAEQKIILRERVEALERLARPDVLVPYKFIEKRLEEFITEHSKGRFLLQMENGMGKTTFVRMLDNLSYNQKSKHKKTLFRAFYINPIYGYKPHSFLQELRDVLRYTNAGQQLTGEIPLVDPVSPNVASQVADMVNAIFAAQRQEGGVQRLLIFLDGLDELPNKGQRPLLEFLPLTENLHDGIYIIITCRTESESSLYTQKLLKELRPEGVACYGVESPEYRDTLLGTIKQQTDAENEQAEKLLALAGGRMVHLATAISAYNQYGNEHLEELPTLAGQGLFVMLEKLYGKRYYSDIRRVATCLALLPLPISAGVLSGLLGEQSVSFRLLAYLGELKPLLNIQRQAQGTEVSLTRPEYREELLDDQTMIDQLQQSWLSYLLLFAGKVKSEFEEENDEFQFDRKDMHIVLTMLLAILWQRGSVARKLLAIPELPKLLQQAILFYLLHRSRDLEAGEVRLYSQLFKCLCSSTEEYVHNQQRADEIVLFLAETLSTLHLEGQGREACELLEQVKSLLSDRKIRVNPSILKELYSVMGTTYENLDQIAEAKKMYEEVNHLMEQDRHCIDKKMPIADFVEKAGSLIRQATLDKNQCNYNQALEKLSRIDNDVLTFTTQEQQENIELLKMLILRDKTYGNIYKRSNPQKAREYFDRAFINYERIATKGINKAYLQNLKVDLLLNSGQGWRALGEYDNALKSYNEALAIYDEKRARGESIDEMYYIFLQQSSGNVYRDLEDWTRALEWYDKALASFEKLSAHGKGGNDTTYVGLLESRAEALENLGRVDEAREARASGQGLDINLARVAHSLRHNITDREMAQIKCKMVDIVKKEKKDLDRGVESKSIVAKSGHDQKNQSEIRQIFWLPDTILPQSKLLDSDEIWLPGTDGNYIMITPLGEFSVTALKKEDFLQRLDRVLYLDPARIWVRSFFEQEQRRVAYLPATEKMQRLWELDSFGKIPRESTAEFRLKAMEEE